MGVRLPDIEWLNRYEVARTEHSVEFRLHRTSTGVLAAIVVGAVVAAGIGLSFAVLRMVASVMEIALVADIWSTPLTAIFVVPPAAWLIFRPGRAAGRWIHRESGNVLAIGSDGSVTFSGTTLVSPGDARAVWIEQVDGPVGESGDWCFEYRVGVDQPGDPVWLPVPLSLGTWMTHGRYSRVPYFSSRSTAERFAAEIGQALAVPVIERQSEVAS